MRNDFKQVYLREGKDGQLQPHDEKDHFRGAAREAFGYLDMLAVRTPLADNPHAVGFVYSGLPNVAKKTNNFGKQEKLLRKKGGDWERTPYSVRQVQRMIRAFQELGALSEKITARINGRDYSGWILYKHSRWAKTEGHICDFRHWEKFSAKQSRLMGHKERSTTSARDSSEETKAA